MKVIESPIVSIGALHWKNILRPRPVSDPIPEGFETINQISAKIGLGRWATTKRIMEAVKAGEVESTKLRVGFSNGGIKKVLFFRPKNYENKPNSNPRHRSDWGHTRRKFCRNHAARKSDARRAEG